MCFQNGKAHGPQTAMSPVLKLMSDIFIHYLFGITVFQNAHNRTSVWRYKLQINLFFNCNHYFFIIQKPMTMQVSTQNQLIKKRIVQTHNQPKNPIFRIMTPKSSAIKVVGSPKINKPKPASDFPT